MEVRLIEFPVEMDWKCVYDRALVTVGKESAKSPSIGWRQKILKAKHSPIRYLRFSFYLEVPYWVSVHLCRHIHAQPYVRSQRNDRQNEYDRNVAPQDAPVQMIWDMNAEELINICEKRLCNQASKETRQVVEAMRDQVLTVCPEFGWVLQPFCRKYKTCNEMFPCTQEL